MTYWLQPTYDLLTAEMIAHVDIDLKHLYKVYLGDVSNLSTHGMRILRYLCKYSENVCITEKLSLIFIVMSILV